MSSSERVGPERIFIGPADAKKGFGYFLGEGYGEKEVLIIGGTEYIRADLCAPVAPLPAAGVPCVSCGKFEDQHFGKLRHCYFESQPSQKFSALPPLTAGTAPDAWRKDVEALRDFVKGMTNADGKWRLEQFAALSRLAVHLEEAHAREGSMESGLHIAKASIWKAVASDDGLDGEEAEKVLKQIDAALRPSEPTTPKTTENAHD